MDDAEKKVVFVITHAKDDQERATIPFILATSAMAMGVAPQIILQMEGVNIAVKGVAEQIGLDATRRLKQLMEAYLDAGHALFACSPCLEHRGIKESDLVGGTIIVGGAKVMEEVLSATNVMCY